MAQGERFPAPPPPSLPREAPWKEIEEIIDGLRVVATKLDSVLSAFAGLPGAPAVLAPPTVITPPGVPAAPPGVPAPALDGRLDALVRFIRIPLHWGTATGGSKDKLVQLGMNWEDNIWAGYEVVLMEGAGAGQVRAIKSNIKDTIVPRVDFDVKPDHTTLYVIRAPSQFRNASSLVTGQKDVTAAGTAEQLPDVEIPDGFRAIIVAKPGNKGYIYLGNSKDNAEDSSVRFDRLEASDSIAVQLDNLNRIWLDASVSGEGISYYIEQA